MFPVVAMESLWGFCLSERHYIKHIKLNVRTLETGVVPLLVTDVGPIIQEVKFHLETTPPLIREVSIRGLNLGGFFN